MRVTRFIMSVLLGLLLGWGGSATPDALTAFAHEQAAVADEGPQESPSHCAGEADQQEHGDHDDCPSKATDRGCCVAACGPVALGPVELQVMVVNWAPVRLHIVTDSMVSDRSVSPLRRPPRIVA